MNCQKCQTELDYRFLENCTNCDGKIAVAEEPQVELFTNLHVERRTQRWRQTVNIAYVFVGSFVGMISGAFVLYITVGVTGSIFLASTGNPSIDCARGNAIGFLALLLGAYLGIVGSTAFTIKHPICSEERV